MVENDKKKIQHFQFFKNFENLKTLYNIIAITQTLYNP